VSITVNLYAAARQAAAQSSIKLEASTLTEVKNQLIQQFPDLASVIPQCSFIVDGHSFGISGNCELNSGQGIDVMPPFSGG
jgi:molybdopterin converting factor small subunit